MNRRNYMKLTHNCLKWRTVQIGQIIHATLNINNNNKNSFQKRQMVSCPYSHNRTHGSTAKCSAASPNFHTNHNIKATYQIMEEQCIKAIAHSNTAAAHSLCKHRKCQINTQFITDSAGQVYPKAYNVKLLI